MARYIDADYIIAQLEKDISMLPDDESKFPVTKGCIIGLNSTISLVKQIPTADVAPRAEVEWLQSQINRLKKYDEERDIALHARLIAETRQKVAREIFDEIESRLLNHIADYYGCYHKTFDELKKKYTGEQTNDTDHPRND